jgi:hypothetical protein
LNNEWKKWEELSPKLMKEKLDYQYNRSICYLLCNVLGREDKKDLLYWLWFRKEPEEPKGYFGWLRGITTKIIQILNMSVI